MDSKAMFKIGYGLYVLTAQENGKDNGCIINTLQQVTDDPLRVSIVVNKANYTCGMIERTGVFNISVIAESAKFDLFTRFGFKSGRTVEKFADFPSPRLGNGVLAVDRNANAIISAKVFSTVDLGTHLLFLADVTDAIVKTSESTATYDYYHRRIKPQPQQAAKAGWRCVICNYFYEGETLPTDFICPICKHGASDFERVSVPAQDERRNEMKKYVCKVCGYVYDPADNNGVAFEDLPGDWTCPTCGVGKDQFEEM